MKRLIDIIFSLIGLLIAAPFLIVMMTLVWFQDFRSPLYIADRVGLSGSVFRMIKLRSMIVNADKSGVDSTGSSDSRITPIGALIRRFKLDEIMQLCNVLKGDMSLVGPRPNVKRETDLYTDDEKLLLTVKPGITDFSSIIFSDEGEILRDKEDPDIAYHQLIRPWKSRLGIFYVGKANILLDFKLIVLTVYSIIFRQAALRRLSQMMNRLGADEELCAIALRDRELVPTPPPGSTKIVTTRDGSV